MPLSASSPAPGQPMSVVLTITLIAVGAAAGANLRYWVGVLVANLPGAGFPYGTLLINIVGSLFIGVVLGAGLSAPARLLMVTGLLGGFTTFSSFSWETYDLLLKGRAVAAVAYMLISVGGGLAATALGVQLVRTLVSKP